MTLRFHQLQFTKIIDEIISEKLASISCLKDIAGKNIDVPVNVRALVSSVIEQNVLSKEKTIELIASKMDEEGKKRSHVPRPEKSSEKKFLSINESGSVTWNSL